MFNFLCTRALLKNAFQTYRNCRARTILLLSRVSSLYSMRQKKVRFPDQFSSVIHRMTNVSNEWFVRCWYTRRETTIHGRLNDEELGRSRLGVARIEEGEMKWKRFARSQTWIVPRLFLLAPLKIPILNATRNVRQPYSYSLSLNPRCIGNEKEVSHCWI